MPGKSEPAKPVDKWLAFGHVQLRPADAVECGWSRELAEKSLAATFPGRDPITAAEAKAALDGAPGNGRGAAGDPASVTARLVEDIVDYRIERAEVAARYEPIRQTRVNLKKLLKSPDVTVEQLRLLAADLGWNVREDEEGVTVPVNDLLPFFRRPVVRGLLEAKMRQVGLAPAAATAGDA